MSLENCRDLKRLKSVDSTHLAKELNIPSKDFLKWLEIGDCRFYPPYYDLSTGKKRLFDVPKWPDRRRFKRINNFFQGIRSHHSKAHGGVKNRSSVSSARAHVGNKFVWTSDVKNCFPSVTCEMFMSELDKLGLCHEQTKMFNDLLMCRDRMPQGCPTSNVALNIFFWHLDFRMVEFCGRRNLAYTRMADDIVISGRTESDGFKANEKLHRMIDNIGLTVNAVKWEKCGFQKSSGDMLVHSLNIVRGKLDLSPEQREKASEVAKETVGICRSLQFCSLKAAIASRNKLHGWYHYCRQTQDTLTPVLKKATNQADAAVKSRLMAEGFSVKDWKWWVLPYSKDLRRSWARRLDEQTIKKVAEKEQMQREFDFMRVDRNHKFVLPTKPVSDGSLGVS